VDGTGTEDQKRDEEWMPACRNCGLPIRESQQPQARFGWTHTGDWQGVRCPGRVTGAVPDVRAAYRAGREDALRWAADQIDPGSREASVARRVDRGMVFVVDADRGTATKLRLWADQQARGDGVQPTEEQPDE
jgi:hypothetical protein